MTRTTGSAGAEVARKAALVRDRICEAGGDPAAVRLLAVTKGFEAQIVSDAVDAGLDLLGESYVQEFAAKVRSLPEHVVLAPTWHFVGRLQRNKVRSLPPVDVIQSVDRQSLAAEIARRLPGQRILVQMNISGEPQKGGCPPAEIADLVGYCADAGLRVEGLMGIAAQARAEVVFEQFAKLRSLADELGLQERSMGMSGDLEAAVRAGSTIVRIGTAIFGPRPSHSKIQ